VICRYCLPYVEITFGMPSSRLTKSVSDLESKLAGFVHSYLAAFRRVDASQQQEELRWVCSGLEYLLGVLLQERDGWAGWVDGINPATDMLPNSISVVSAVELSVRGWAIWGESAGAGPFWLEPFFGSVRISDTADAIVRYDLRFGDAVRGLGKFPHSKHLRRVDWFFPTEWMFTFSKGPSGEAEHPS
jgi:hypothetical protein